MTSEFKESEANAAMALCNTINYVILLVRDGFIRRKCGIGPDQIRLDAICSVCYEQNMSS